MARFAFFMLPEPGHILPTLRLASRLQKEGHSVTYLSPPYLRNFFRTYGFDSANILESISPKEPVEIWRAPAGTEVFEMLFFHLQSLKVSLAELLGPDLDRVAFDVLVCDGVISARWGEALKSMLGRPVVSLHAVLPEDFSNCPAGIRQIVLCPEEFCLNEERCALPAGTNRFLHAEPSVFRARVSEHLRIEMKGPEPLIYCSLGTQTSRYGSGRLTIMKSIVEAVKRLPVQLIISAGGGRDILDLQSLPHNVTVLPTAPQLDLLHCARVFITHGGLGSLKESIMAGVPCLVIPFDIDQPRNAARIEYHGLGRACVPKECHPERIRDLAALLLEDRETQFRVSRMSRVFWRYENMAPGADLLVQSVLPKGSGGEVTKGTGAGLSD